MKIMRKNILLILIASVFTVFEANAQNDTLSIQSGDTVNISLSTSRGSIQWQESTDLSTWNDISGATTATLFMSVTTLPTYIRAVLSDGDCNDHNTPYVVVESCQGAPQLTTTAVSGITQTTAQSGGTITFDGCGTIQAKGVCWNTSPNPTIANFTTNDGGGTGAFTSSLTNLIPGMTYYVRAYANNGISTGYGPEVSFMTTGGYQIGDTGPGGGIIFYLDGSGGGMEVDTVDLSTNAPWGCNGATIGTGNAVGTGKTNTAAIVSNGCLSSGDAADLCDNLNKGGFSDWFLPSRDELDSIKVNVHDQGMGNFNTLNEYWSSSEAFQFAWSFNFGSGTFTNVGRTTTFRVRAVREF